MALLETTEPRELRSWCLPTKCRAHVGTNAFPWGFGSRSAFLFPAVSAEGRGWARELLGYVVAKRKAPGPLPRPESRTPLRGQPWSPGFREKELQGGRDCRLGPAAACSGRPRVRSGTFLASGGFKASLTPTISDPQLWTRENSSWA